MQKIEIDGADNTLILSYCRYMCSCLEWPSKAPCPVRAAKAGKAGKAKALPRFCRIESGGRNSSTPLMWPCLPKSGSGSPAGGSVVLAGARLQ